MTVSGLNFRTSDSTATSGLGLQSCSTASWSSGTSIVCTAIVGTGSLLQIVITADSVVGTRTAGFTFDGKYCLYNILVKKKAHPGVRFSTKSSPRGQLPRSHELGAHHARYRLCWRAQLRAERRHAEQPHRWCGVRHSGVVIGELSAVPCIQRASTRIERSVHRSTCRHTAARFHV